MTEFNTTPEGRAFYLETLIRQQRHWVIESDANGNSNAAIVEHRRRRLAELKVELGVTDEAQFLREQEAKR